MNSSTSNLSTTSSDPFYGLSFKVGVAENKNVTYRSKMEDVHTYVANFAERLDWGYFAIFDGHAGKQAARWCGNNLHICLEQEILHSEQRNLDSEDMRDNICKSFIKADEMISKEGSGNSGCTAAVFVLAWEPKTKNSSLNHDNNDATIPNHDDTTMNTIDDANIGDRQPHDTHNDKNNNKQNSDNNNTTSHEKVNDNYEPTIDYRNHKRMMYTANVGDSRIILYRGGNAYRLTYDHKASDVNEVNRIRDAGGLVLKNRVNGVLAVTRSLGDSYMKDLVVGTPFTTATEIHEYDEFLILACDGIWDVITDVKACEIVKESFTKSDDPEVAAKKLCQIAMDNSTTDNITVMVVKLDTSIFKPT